MKNLSVWLLFVVSMMVFVTACSDDDDDMGGGTPEPPTENPNLVEYEESTFTENDFITVLTDSPNGKTIRFGPGTYNFSNTIPLAEITDLTIVGAGREQTIFDFSNSTSTSGEGIAAIDCNDLVFCGFTIQNTNGGNGITARNIKGLRFNDVGTVWPESSQDNGVYGIYPVQSDDVIVENCYAQAAIDAGIYSGQNQRVILRNNTLTLNVFGMEVENNIDAEVYGNTFVENTAGLLVYDLAGVEKIKNGKNCKVYNNTFTNNNQSNFAELGSTFAADVPPGIGLLYASTSSLEITDNTFTDNESASILGVSYFLVDNMFNPLNDLEFTFFNDNIHIHDNAYSKGGAEYNTQGVLDRPAGALLLAVNALNGGEVPHILLDDQDYTAAGLPTVGQKPVIDEPSEPSLVQASFVGAAQSNIQITSTFLEDFTGEGYVMEPFSLENEPSECN